MVDRGEISFARPMIGNEEYLSLKEVISSGWIAQGKKVQEFERIFAEHINASYAVAVSSCTAALHLALLIEGIGRGDEVLCPSFSFIATANAIEFVGAKPIFVDIDSATFNIDPKDIERHITKKTKAIIVVHQIGLAADMNAISRIAKYHRLKLVEDAACAQGAIYKGRMVGSIGPVTCFSFHPRKIITTGEGGMITTNSKRIAELASILRSHAASISDVLRHKAGGTLFERYYKLGFNYRMTDLQAAIGIVQMKRLNVIIKKRQEIASFYNKELRGLPIIETPYVPKDYFHTFQSYLIKFKHKNKTFRDNALREMSRREISCRRGITPIHLEPYYLKKYGRIHLSATEDVSVRSLFLPIHPSLKKEELRYIIDNFKEIAEG